MKLDHCRRQTLPLLCRGGLIYIWLLLLAPIAGSEEWLQGYYAPYALWGMAAGGCLMLNHQRCAYVSGREHWVLGLCAAVFSGAVMLANYSLLEGLRTGRLVVDGLGLFAGGLVSAYEILLYALRSLPLARRGEGRHRARGVFWSGFVLIAAVDLLFWWSAEYPGILTEDSFGSVDQIIFGKYYNLLPYWYTMTVKLFFRIGTALLGSYSGGVAVFTVAQILLMAATVAYGAVTLYQIRAPRWMVGTVLVWHILMPYNIVYSVSMWKDVLFSLGCMLTMVSIYRILRGVGRRQWANYLVLLLGGLGFATWRTNGWYVMALMTVLMLLFGRRHRGLLACLVAVTAIGWVMIGPWLDYIGVGDGPVTELLSIPLQQICRVLHEDGYFMPQERELLSQILDLEAAARDYQPYIADPIKWGAFRRENTAYFKEHILEYARIWLRVARRYPGTYLKAWIEQTKGYWCGGYNYVVYGSGIIENSHGLVSRGCVSGIGRLFREWFRLVEESRFMKVFYSIGLHIWVTAVCGIVNALKRRRELLVSLPLAVILLGLWVGTPVFAEFRYGYPVILTLPFLLGITAVHAPEKCE